MGGVVVNRDGTDIGELGSARACIAISGHATNAVPRGITRGLQVNVAGDVVVKFPDSDDDVTLTLLAGVTYSFRITHLRATGTTATGIHAIY